MVLPGQTVYEAREEKNSMKKADPNPLLGMPFRALMESSRKGVPLEQIQAAERAH